jgi:hypothetical protein
LKGVTLGSLSGEGRTVRRVPGSSAASLANEEKKKAASAAHGGLSGIPSAVASGKEALALGDAGSEGQAVAVTTHGVNGATVCAFARYAQIHVAKWLTEARADGERDLPVPL